MTLLEKNLLVSIDKHRRLLFLVIAAVIGLLIRWAGRDFVSFDMRDALLPWFDQIKAAGGLPALSSQVGDYGLFYQTIISLMTYVSVPAIYQYKLLSVIFDAALAVMAALELGKRRRAAEVMQRRVIRDSVDAFEYIQDRLTDLDHEEFWMISLKNNHEILEKFRISTGGVTSTIVDSKLIFKKLILSNAVAFILCHNHPSDKLAPSLQDRQLTKRLSQAALLLDMRLLDHLVIGHQHYFSFKDEGLL